MKHSLFFIFLASTSQIQSSEPTLSLTPQQVNPLPNQTPSTGHTTHSVRSYPTTRDTTSSTPDHNYFDYPNQQQRIIPQEAKKVVANLLRDFDLEFPH